MLAEKEIIVREATEKDSKGIIEVLKSTRLDEETWNKHRAFVRRSLKKFLKQNIVLVAEFNSSVVGFVDCAVFPSLWEGQKQGLIADFFVHPAYQDKGVGSRLLEMLIKRADAENIVELHVSTERGNIKAQKLYRKYGFTGEQLLLERSQRD